MGIAGINQGLGGLFAPWTKTDAKTDTALGSQLESPEPIAVPQEALSILKRFDLQRITPRELSSLVGELQKAGAISPAEAQQLTRLRSELDEAGVGSDDSINLLEVIHQRIAQLRKQLADVRERGDDPQAVASLEATATSAIDQGKILDKLEAARINGGIGALDVRT